MPKRPTAAAVGRLQDRTQLIASLIAAGAHRSSAVATIASPTLAATTADGLRVVEVAARAGVTVALGFNRRFHPIFEQARGLLHDGRLGRVRAVQTTSCEPASPDAMPEWKRRRAIGARRNAACLALGGPDVAETCRWLSEQVVGMATYPGDRLPLGTIWAAIAQCDLHLGNDSGLMHMAAAAGIPVMVVIGLAGGARAGTRGDTSHTGPYDTPSRIVRPSAGTRHDGELNTALIPSEAVVTATIELMTS